MNQPDARKANQLEQALRRLAAESGGTFDPRPPWERERDNERKRNDGN